MRFFYFQVCHLEHSERSVHMLSVVAGQCIDFSLLLEMTSGILSKLRVLRETWERNYITNITHAGNKQH